MIAYVFRINWQWLMLNAGPDGVYLKIGPVEFEWDRWIVFEAVPTVVACLVMLTAIYAWIHLKKR